jgi:hypothetical protein
MGHAAAAAMFAVGGLGAGGGFPPGGGFGMHCGRFGPCTATGGPDAGGGFPLCEGGACGVERIFVIPRVGPKKVAWN